MILLNFSCGIRNRLGILIVATTALCFWGVNVTQGDVVLFRDGEVNRFSASAYDGTQDASLGALASWNYGGATTFEMNQGNAQRRAVIRFEGLSVVGAEVGDIVSARLILSQVESSAQITEFTFSAHQLTDANAGWEQGVDIGTSRTTDSVTWNRKIHPVVWPTGNVTWAGSGGAGTPGVDYVATALDSATYSYGDLEVEGDTNGDSVALNLPVVLVQQWVNGGVNAGLLLKTDGIGNNFARFASSESLNAEWRPALELTFVDVPEPASLGLFMAGCLLMCRQRTIWRPSI